MPMLHHKSFAQLIELYRSGQVSPLEVVKEALADALRINAKLNAFAVIDCDKAMQSAQLAAQRWRADRPLGPLDGVPLTVKEFANVQGWLTTRGSLATKRAAEVESTAFVQRLQDAGAVLLGKTRAPEFNWKGVTDSPAFGITCNPWDYRKTPGGSSGGCAAAVAAGVVRVSIGSDAAGSIRIPASFSGVIGLKPSYGRIPLVPNPKGLLGLAHAGPLARDIDDLALVYVALAGPCAQDPDSLLCPRPDNTLEEDIAHLKLGLLQPRHWRAQSSPVVAEAMNDFIELLSKSGLRLTEVDFDINGASLVAARLYEMACRGTVDGIDVQLRHLLDPGLLEFVRGVEPIGSEQYHHQQQARATYSHKLADIFNEVDILVLPTMPLVAFAAGVNAPPDYASQAWTAWNPFTPAFNGAGVPAMSYPLWPGQSELPVGVQLVAAYGCEHKLLALGRWLQRRLPVRVAV